MRFALVPTLVLLFSTAAGACRAAEPSTGVIRIGIIGLDTSHVPAFTQLFNSSKATGDLAGFRVVAGYPGGTDFGPSKTRVEQFTEGMRKAGVEIVSTIPELLQKVDVVLLESVDGRIHLQEAIPVIEAGKPMFIDKPLAGSLTDAVAIAQFAAERGVPWFSSSAYRFSPAITGLLNNEAVGDIAGAAAWGACSHQAGTMDLSFYGIHVVEGLYTLMGPGCQTVTRIKEKNVDLVSGTWAGGRVGTVRGIRGAHSAAGAMVFGTKGIVVAEKVGGYEPLCQAIGRFFKTKVPPVSPEVTLELFGFMEAADESQRRGGQPVAIAEVLEKARGEAARRLADVRM